MSENIDTLNLLLDQSAKYKRSCAETWELHTTKPCTGVFRLSNGKNLMLKTFDVPQPRSQSNLTGPKASASDPR